MTVITEVSPLTTAFIEVWRDVDKKGWTKENRKRYKDITAIAKRMPAYTPVKQQTDQGNSILAFLLGAILF